MTSGRNILIFETFNTIVLFRPFGAWTRQRQDEKYALKYSPVFLRTKRLSKGGKGEARAVEEKKRKAAEKKIEVEKVAKDELEASNEQCLLKKRFKEQKNIAREEKEQKRRELEDNYLRLEREEKRRLRIAELHTVKV